MGKVKSLYWDDLMQIQREGDPYMEEPDIEDIVGAPSHYTQGTIQPIDFITANNLNYCEGNVVKYITRHKYKGGAEDVRKAMQYCEFILAEYGDER